MWRQNQALARRLHVAKLRGNACIEEIDYRSARGLDKSVIRELAQESSWVRNRNTFSFSGRPRLRHYESPHYISENIDACCSTVVDVGIKQQRFWRS
jgi:hypothetical protein